ncbi:MAG: nitroreductase family protein [Acidobacteriota bacterium]
MSIDPAPSVTPETDHPHATPPPSWPRVELQGGDLAVVAAYHRLSMLDPERHGALPGRLERLRQPVPFRRYLGAATTTLPRPDGDLDNEPKTPAALNLLGQVLGDALGVVGWRRHAEAAFGLRATPSAGNLHPLEAYLAVPGLGAGESPSDAELFHYSAFDHALERRRRLPVEVWDSLRAAAPEARAVVVLTAIYWRTAWKYGERAFRLAHLDAGHGLAALDAAAAVVGLKARWVDAASADLEILLGIDGDSGPEAEDAVAMVALEPADADVPASGWWPEADVLDALVGQACSGVPSRISERHRIWPGGVAAARATRREREVADGPREVPSATGPASTVFSRDVLRRRRSRAVYEGRALTQAELATIASHLVGDLPAGLWGATDLVTLLFVHRVEGVEPGLYALFGGPEAGIDAEIADLRAVLRAELEWRDVELEPLDTASGAGRFRLVRLTGGDSQRAASHLAGGQTAAGDGGFCALFLGKTAALARDGAWAYRRLHWLAGARAHRLYLAAEDLNLGATGLGGFYDDQLANLLGLDVAGAEREARPWEPLYLAAVGRRAATDPPLEPPYDHRGSGAEPVPASQGGYRTLKPQARPSPPL